MFNKEKRDKTRFIWTDLDYYKVLVDFDNISYEEGKIGNISEEGMCIILDSDHEIGSHSKVNATLVNLNRIDPTKNKFSVSGEVVWQKKLEEENNLKTMVGIKFLSEADFPEDIVAHCMAMEI